MSISRANTFIRSKQIKATRLPLTPPNYANMCVFVSVMKHKYYSVLAGDLLFVFTACQDYFIFSRVNRKMWRKREIPENNQQTIRKQNLACLTWVRLEPTAARWRAIYTQGNRVFRCRRLSDFGGKQRRHGVTGSVFIYFYFAYINYMRPKNQVGRLYIERFEYGIR